MQGGQVHDLDLEKNIDSFYRDKEEYDLILKKKNNKFIISTRDIDKPDDFRSYVDKEMPIGDSTDDLGNRYQIFRKKRVE